MVLKVLFVATLVLGLSTAKPPSVVQYWGVPGNTNDEPSIQFVDLGQPLIKEYEEEIIGLNIPQPPQPQTAVTPKPLIIEYSHNPINDLYKVPPKQIQVVEAGNRKPRQIPADINEIYKPIINLPQLGSSSFKIKRSPDHGIRTLRNYYTHQRVKHPRETTTTEAFTKVVPEFYEHIQEEVSESPELESHEDVFSEDDVEEEERNKKAIEEEFKKQAKSAKYQFASNVNDQISGNQHNREETRDGVNVKGSYSYNDGYFRHTVHYVADDKGYRVVKQEHQPLMGDGPQYNPEGEANVATYMDGKTLSYKVKEDDYAPFTKLRVGMGSVRKQHPLMDSSEDVEEEAV